jgi:hypothetical protein
MAEFVIVSKNSSGFNKDTNKYKHISSPKIPISILKKKHNKKSSKKVRFGNITIRHITPYKSENKTNTITNQELEQSKNEVKKELKDLKEVKKIGGNNNKSLGDKNNNTVSKSNIKPRQLTRKRGKNRNTYTHKNTNRVFTRKHSNIKVSKHQQPETISSATTSTTSTTTTKF